MAVSKRLRFEVLRRDEHTCQYCGATARDSALHVDHLVPVSLGGSDDPGNLVAACKDCNVGKSSVPADAPIVKQVSEQAAAYALALTDKMTRIRGRLQDEQEFIDQFDDAWGKWKLTQSQKSVPLPPDYKVTLRQWCHMGVPEELVSYAVEVAMERTNVAASNTFKYMCGVVWRQLDSADAPYSLTENTTAVYTQLEADEMASERGADGYQYGFHKGYRAALEHHGIEDDR